MSNIRDGQSRFPIALRDTRIVMSCSTHPQWLHDAADCPFCASRSASVSVEALIAQLLQMKLRPALAQLRHAYWNLTSLGPSLSPDQQREFAEGLIAPQIRRLEEFDGEAAAALRSSLAMPPHVHDLVTCSLKDPDWVAHPRRLDCEHETPHLMSACGAFMAPRSSSPAEPDAPRLQPPPATATGDEAENTTDQPKSWIAWKRRAEQLEAERAEAADAYVVHERALRTSLLGKIGRLEAQLAASSPVRSSQSSAICDVCGQSVATMVCLKYHTAGGKWCVGAGKNISASLLQGERDVEE